MEVSTSSHCRDCEKAYDVAEYKWWLKDIADELPNLRTIILWMDVEWPETDVAYAWPQSPHTFKLRRELRHFVDMKCLSSLKVCKWPTDTSSDDPDDYELWVSWDKQNGLQAPKAE